MAKNKDYLRVVRLRHKAKSDLEMLKDTEYYKEVMEKRGVQYASELSFNISTGEADLSNPDRDVFIEAEMLMEKLNTGELMLGQLDLEKKCKILYYLERYNKRVGRILDIQTRIPVSSMKLEKPKMRFQIASDYVMGYFNKLFNSYEFQSVLEKVVRHYWLFSFASVLIEDDYEFLKDSVQLKEIDVARELHLLKPNKLSEEQKQSIDEVDIRYRKDPDNITLADKMKVVNAVFSRSDKDYKGVVRMSVLPVFSTINRMENNDIDYHIYEIKISDEMLKTLDDIKSEFINIDSEKEVIKEMLKTGYSRSMIEAYINLTTNRVYENHGNVYLVDTDPFNSIGMYVAAMVRPGLTNKDNSLFNRVISDCIDLSVASQRLRQKLNTGYKKDILVNVSGVADQARLDSLADVLTENAKSTEGTITVTNLEVNTQEIDFNINGQIDVQEVIENANKSISEGVGVPESLISESLDAYANSFLKTIILENEMINFRNQLKYFIEEKIFKPISIKFGFIAEDEWGETIAIYPKVAFNRMTLARGSDDIELLKTMAEAGQMPLRPIFESLGIDYDEALQGIQREQTDIINPVIREAIGAAIAEKYGEKIASALPTMEALAKKFELSIDDLMNNKNSDDE